MFLLTELLLSSTVVVGFGIILLLFLLQSPIAMIVFADVGLFWCCFCHGNANVMVISNTEHHCCWHHSLLALPSLLFVSLIDKNRVAKSELTKL